MGETDIVTVYGIVGGFFCEKSGRAIELYYLDIFDHEPEYDEKTLFSSFKFYLKSLICH
jgi:hypothetical protein